MSPLFAGTHGLDEMISELWTPYFRSAVPACVSCLDEASAHRPITQPIEDFALNYEAEAVDWLIREARCHKRQAADWWSYNPSEIAPVLQPIQFV